MLNPVVWFIVGLPIGLYLLLGRHWKWWKAFPAGCLIAFGAIGLPAILVVLYALLAPAIVGPARPTPSAVPTTRPTAVPTIDPRSRPDGTEYPTPDLGPKPAPTPGIYLRPIFAKVNSLSVRDGPGTQYIVVEYLTSCAGGFLLLDSDTWAEVIVGRRAGYVSKAYTSFTSSGC
jgi:hypothetical protein